MNDRVKRPWVPWETIIASNWNGVYSERFYIRKKNPIPVELHEEVLGKQTDWKNYATIQGWENSLPWGCHPEDFTKAIGITVNPNYQIGHNNFPLYEFHILLPREGSGKTSSINDYDDDYVKNIKRNFEVNH